jgi:hypothetical protein
MPTERITLKLADDCPYGKKGQVVTLALQPADVHDPTELPTYLAGYMPFEYRADEASPIILVDNDQDKYRNFNSDDAFRRVDVKAGIQSPVPEVDPTSTLNSYKVVDRFCGSFVPRVTELQTGNNYKPRQAAARRVKRALQLDREVDVWSLLSTTTNWATANVFALGAGFQWGNLTSTGQGVNSDPIFDLQNLATASAQYIARHWMNLKTGFGFLRHPNVRNHMRQLLGDQAVTDTTRSLERAAATGQRVDFVIPGFAPFSISAAKVKNESTGNLDFVLPDGVVIGATVPPGVPTDGEEIATTYTFRRRGPSGVGFETREYFIDGRGPLGGTMVVASMADIAIMTGSNCGGVITGALQ